MAFWSKKKEPAVRTIKTARSLEAINQAALQGFRPLIKPVMASLEIRSKYCVLQHKKTGLVKVLGDFRQEYDESEYLKIIDWTFHYPHAFRSPFAAYLIPADIQANEQVFVEDLIEDFIGARWNQGDVYRLEGCMAVWTGSDLIIQYTPTENRTDFVG